MYTQGQIEQWIMELGPIKRIHPFGEQVAVFSLGAGEQEIGELESRKSEIENGPTTMFALINEGSKPIKLSLRCDPKLAQLLREKYEVVLPGENLSKNNWNTIVCTDQIAKDELKDLIRHSYELTKA